MKPYFSIVIPLYNKERHIKTTINSVLAQKFIDFELIVVDDGSTDHSAELVKSIDDSRLQLYTIDNQGVSHARNFGIDKANSEFICFLDADDIWHSHHLENIKHMVDLFPKSGMYCTAYDKKINGTHYKCHYHSISEPDFLDILEDYFKASYVDSIANSSGIMIPKMIFKALGGFNEQLDSGEDTDVWIRIALDYDICFYNNISVTINHDSDNRISEKHILNRKVMDLDKFEIFTKDHTSLKKYLDINRFSLGMQCKLTGELELAKNYLDKINLQNINSKQKFLKRSPRLILILSKQIQNILRKLNINLSSFR
ncbi:MAG: glycosyltransferase family A protein [Psychroserpens sp.]|uniref:glycosyltransferase family 2 protein n=1 Tax=Psychroserpens sp. TaxID=2020870 RepID=UPI0030031C8D